MPKKKFKVHIGDNKPLAIRADFMHVKEGVPCLYVKSTGYSRDLPDVIFALTAPGYIIESAKGVNEDDD